MSETSNHPLADQVAVVTGGSRGIGRAIAGQLAVMGASVVITGRSQAQLDESAQQISRESGATTGIACDIADLRSVDELGKQVHERHGHVDILVNNAGIGGPPAPLHELPPHEWEAIFHTNLRGVYYMLRAFVPQMIARGSGHIINISSLAGKNPLPRGAAYAASKWALNGLSYSVAEELRSHNIRVSVICPGSVNTSFSPHPGKSAEKMLQPDDVAHAVEMLVTQRPQSFISEILLRPTQKP